MGLGDFIIVCIQYAVSHHSRGACYLWLYPGSKDTHEWTLYSKGRVSGFVTGHFEWHSRQGLIDVIFDCWQYFSLELKNLVAKNTTQDPLNENYCISNMDSRIYMWCHGLAAHIFNSLKNMQDCKAFDLRMLIQILENSQFRRQQLGWKGLYQYSSIIVWCDFAVWHINPEKFCNNWEQVRAVIYSQNFPKHTKTLGDSYSIIYHSDIS